MTTDTDIANRALASVGTRTTIASLAEQSNEAIQANLVFNTVRDELLRLAPWNCATNYANLTLITAVPGTPENTSVAPVLWNKSLPAPPWAYEYQYPSDCIRALWIVPQYATGFASGIPITTAFTGGAPSFWNGPPSRFKVSVDQPVTATAAAASAAGSGYAVGDTITLTGGTGVPTQLTVATLAGSGVATVTISISGSYLTSPANPVAQGSTSGSGSGATFNLTLSSAADRRVILTNQEFAILAYIKQVTDENVWDSQFTEAMVAALAGRLTFVLTGDKALANQKLGEANTYITLARQGDGNEGLTINNVTPDWIRTRGIVYDTDYGWSPNVAYDWGGLLSLY